MPSSNKAPVGVAIKELAALRATYALTNYGGDVGIGFAEGVENINGVLWASAWCAIALRNGNVFFSHKRIGLPPQLAKKADDNTLLEAELESFLQERLPKLYDQLVEVAMKSIIS